jgi:uncharacterized protein (TIGR02466 family)
VELVNNIIKIFPVDIFIQENLPINKDIMESKILNMEKEKSGRVKSNMGGFQSQPIDNNDMWEEFNNLMTFITNSFTNICNHYKYKEGIKINISAPWININRYKDSNAAHVHGEADWSYVYFVKVPKDSGNLVFLDPRIRRTAKNLKENLLENNSENLSQITHYGLNINDNSLIFFPSYMEHAVHMNKTHNPRITISGNTFVG